MKNNDNDYVILRPIRGKKQSLYWPINKIYSVVIPKMHWDNYCKGDVHKEAFYYYREKNVKILSFREGCTSIYNSNMYEYAKKNQAIKVNLDHFEAFYTYDNAGSEVIDIFF